jgi:uncharacterized protein YraI
MLTHVPRVLNRLPPARLLRAVVGVLLIAMIALAGYRPAQADTGSNWTGNYYNNPGLIGNPIFTRIDPALIFNWGSYPPGPGLNGNFWSARWTTQQYLNAGTYRFNVTADDGVRVFIDGQPILDQWRDQTASFTVNVQVVAGYHGIQVDYYQGQGTAQLAVTWDYLGGVQTQWLAQYFNNPYLQGTPLVTRGENTLNFNWTGTSPDPSIPANYFSARFTASLPFAAGTYRLTLTADDGIRLWIDGLPVVDQWTTVPSVTAYSIDVPLSAGVHNFRIEYFQWTGGATLRFDYQTAIGPPPYPLTPWYGEYFGNPFLQGSPVFVRNDGAGAINYDWSRTGPGRGIGLNNYSVRWTRRMFFPGRPYNFYLTSDDGARLYIDTTLIIDNWKPQPATTVRVPVDLTEGVHDLRLEYFQNSYDAVISLTWDPPNGQNPPLPYTQMITRSALPFGSVTATVTSYKLFVRRGPGAGYGDIGGINRGETYQVVGRNSDNTWLQINVNGLVGWSSSAYLTVVGSLENVPITG